MEEVNDVLRLDAVIVLGVLSLTCSAACSVALIVGAGDANGNATADTESNAKLLAIRIAMLLVCILTQVAILLIVVVFIVSPVQKLSEALLLVNDLHFDHAKELLLTYPLSQKVQWTDIFNVATNLTITCSLLAEWQHYIPESVFLHASTDFEESEDEDEHSMLASANQPHNPLESSRGSRLNQSRASLGDRRSSHHQSGNAAPAFGTHSQHSAAGEGDGGAAVPDHILDAPADARRNSGDRRASATASPDSNRAAGSGHDSASLNASGRSGAPVPLPHQTDAVADDAMSYATEDCATLRHNGLLGANEVPLCSDAASHAGSTRSRNTYAPRGNRIVRRVPKRLGNDGDGGREVLTAKSQKSGGTARSRTSGKSTASTAIPIDVYNEKAVKKLHKLQGDRGFRMRVATLLRVDLDGSEPQHVVNLFVNCAADSTRHYEGVALTVTGSSFVATWNAYKSNHAHAIQACKCAMDFHLKMKDALAGRATTTWRTSIVTGHVRVGIVGSESIRAPAVTGEAVNLLSKLGILGRQTGARLLMTHSSYNLVRDAVFARPIEVVSLESFGEDTVAEAIYELVHVPCTTQLAARSGPGDTLELPTTSDCGAATSPTVSYTQAFGKPDHHEYYLEAVSALRQCNFSACVGKMTQFLQSNPGDKQATRILKIALLYQSKDTKPSEYKRPFVGWLDVEEQSKEATMPEDVEDVDHLAETMQVMDFARETEMTDEIRLQEKIREATAMAMGSSTSEKETTNTFVDTKGRKWVLLGKELGRGGYGRVNLGMSPEGGLVAIKTMTKLTKAEELVDEVSVMVDLRNEYTVSYLASGLFHQTAFVVMEWVCGGSLKDVLKSCGAPLPTSVVKRYSQDILKGLRYLHMKQILHRDLKPHNVLLTPEGVCKLADFGASAKVCITSIRKQEFVGTPMYMSPESCRGEACMASDVWSFGVTICQLLSCSLPYRVNASTKFNVFMYVARSLLLQLQNLHHPHTQK